MGAVGGEDRGAHVSADLCCAERTWPAAACLALQRGRAAVPAFEPAAQYLTPAFDCMAASECGEAATGVVWSVLEEDLLLGLGAEV